jgi:pimeloyl-ACP methyl ester carboxylesterase
MAMPRFSFAALLASLSVASAQTMPGWPTGVSKVEIPCSDGVRQQAMWFKPSTPGKKPLLVGLHTWSSTFASAGGDAVYAKWCINQGWIFIHPDFRGPNWTPPAMGSDRAVQDVVEAVAWAKKQAEVDDTRVYLIGVSGGGHMAMQMAGRHPELWSAVSAWCGISDIVQWHRDHSRQGKPDRYAQNIEAALGHPPSTEDTEAKQRSPLTHLRNATNVPLDIAHGIHDGRKGSVPFTHALLAFNEVAAKTERLSAEAIEKYYVTLTLPTGWPAALPDATYGLNTPLFRRTSGNTRVTIFEGGHEIVHQAALNWLAMQRKGQPAVWDLKKFLPLEADGTSGK